MKRLLRGMAIATAVIAPTITSIAPSAQALQGNAFYMAGSGTISPGLNVVPTLQRITFSGTGAVYAGTGGILSSASCNGSGEDQIGTFAVGAGPVNINCTVGSDSTSFWTEFVRVGAAAIIEIAPSVIQFGGGVCVFAPSGGLNLPWTSFDLACDGGYAQGP